MYVYHNTESSSDIDIEQIFARQTLICQLKEYFTSFGYKEISSSMFEPYHLYAQMNGTVNEQAMIKTIDNTGQVLVLRPDVTIPLTKQIAKNEPSLKKHLRYFYVLDVYRQAYDTKEYDERTQAGVEFFGNASSEADAEVIALAAEILQLVHADHYKIEIGHAGFFKQLTSETEFTNETLLELRQLIQAKNIPDLNRLLDTLDIADELKKTIASLPFLYGKVDDVLEKTTKLSLSEDVKKKLNKIKEIYTILEAYNVAENVVLDLSLINHMDYYSDIIFQGYIEKIGKPVIMGGRYDTLAEQFEAQFPAIGFACDVDLLFNGMDSKQKAAMPPSDFAIVYDKTNEADAIRTASFLRKEGFKGFTVLAKLNEEILEAKSYIYIQAEKRQLTIANNTYSFADEAALLDLLQQKIGG